MPPQYALRIACADRPGILAALTGFLWNDLGGNILDLNHYTDDENARFFFLCRFTPLNEASPPRADLMEYPRFRELHEIYEWDARLYDLSVKPRVALLVSKTDHCLYELILKTREGYLNADLCCVLSNHETLAPIARYFGLPFHHFPMTGDRAAQEANLEASLRDYGAENVALARYMQILSAGFTQRWSGRVINVHHGFLPAFKGARPYHQAWERGVKIIGATAHYATEDLDEGPILYQDVIPVKNNWSVKGFIEAGRDIERKVIVEGLKLHLDRRVFLHHGRAIVL